LLFIYINNLALFLDAKKIEKKYSVEAEKPLSGFYVYNLSCIKSRIIWVFTQFLPAMLNVYIKLIRLLYRQQ